MDKDYYKILGVLESDSPDNIKWHPDVAGNSADVLSMFKEINEAYEILSDRFKKSEYDKARKFYNYAKNGAETTKEPTANYNNENSSFKNFSKNINDWFYGKQKSQESNKKQQPLPKRGKDIYAEVEISVFDAINGTEKIINVLQSAPCPKCNGRKFVNEAICQHCNGTGEVSKHKKFTVKIPAGIKNGAKIRLSGEGGEGSNGGSNGDLYITVNVKQNDYKTEGLNIIKTVYLEPYEAVLGGNIDIKTINGNYNVKINPNTQNGQKIRLSGCGIVQNDKIGDMIIVLEIRIPKTLSKAEIELYRKLSEISTRNIRDSIYD